MRTVAIYYPTTDGVLVSFFNGSMEQLEIESLEDEFIAEFDELQKKSDVILLSTSARSYWTNVDRRYAPMHNEIERLLLLPPPADPSDPDPSGVAKDLDDSEKVTPSKSVPSQGGSSLALHSYQPNNATAQSSKSVSSWSAWCITM